MHSQSAHVVNKLFSRYSQLPFGTPSSRMRSCRLNEFCTTSFAREKRKIITRCVYECVCVRPLRHACVAPDRFFKRERAFHKTVARGEKCGRTPRALTSHAFLSDVRGLIFYCALTRALSRKTARSTGLVDVCG
jgi:hypothetical protein